jgi:predicted Holliday junction resolvase-like endonuclease
MSDAYSETILLMTLLAFAVGVLLTATIAAAIIFWQHAQRERYIRRERDSIQTVAREWAERERNRILAEADQRAAEWGAKHFEQQRAHLEQTYRQQFTSLLELWKAEEETRIRSESTAQQRAVLKGKIAEQVISLFPGFPYNPADARFIGDPLDYVIFSGSSAVASGQDNEIEVIFADVKTGTSQLTKRQRCIRDAVQVGRVRWEVLRVDEHGQVIVT